MAEPRTVHLIDASPYVFRAWFALPSTMTSPDGAPVNAVHGFVGFLLRYFEEEGPTHVGVAFDESLTTSFRNELYPDYKAGRELPPPELEAQLAACQEAAAALGAATFVDDRYEADDLIATLAHALVRRGHRAVVVSSDKDLAQLVSDRVELFDFARETRYGPAEVEAKFGVRPDQIADWLGLAGDAVDNIPGVAGVGAKTAAALLAELGDLDGIYADLDAVGELSLRGARSVAARLAADRERAFLSRRLATVARDAPARAGLRELRLRAPDRQRLEALFGRLGFRMDRVDRTRHGARRR